jgi:hypothetical protein
MVKMIENRGMPGKFILPRPARSCAICLIAGVIVVALFSTRVLAQEPAEEQAATTGSQSEDGAESTKEEAAKKKEDRGNFLVLPIFITEPAIGEGLGLGLIYFHKKKDPNTPRMSTASAMSQTNRQQNPPPTATGVFGAYTN